MFKSGADRLPRASVVVLLPALGVAIFNDVVLLAGVAKFNDVVELA